MTGKLAVAGFMRLVILSQVTVIRRERIVLKLPREGGLKTQMQRTQANAAVPRETHRLGTHMSKSIRTLLVASLLLGLGGIIIYWIGPPINFGSSHLVLQERLNDAGGEVMILQSPESGIMPLYSASLFIKWPDGTVWDEYYLGHESGYWWSGDINVLEDRIAISKNGSPIATVTRTNRMLAMREDGILRKAHSTVTAGTPDSNNSQRVPVMP